MSTRVRVFSSSVGTKLLIGFTGFLLFLYLLIHIAGNALIVFGPEVFNNYAYVMEVQNKLLPLIEVALLIVFAVHIYKTIGMFLGNQSARPVRYVRKKLAGPPSRKTIASSTMIVSGLWLVVFLVIHVKAFRFSPEYEWHGGGRDLYRQEFENLSNPLVVGFYVLSMLVVGSHLWHGISSSLQSLGFDHPKWTPRMLLAGKLFATAVALGFMIIAVWVYLNQPVGV
ncbi:MAG TPA: succinate dehydrogenase cytochrome b subunit [Vicinamibacterales bacterium]|nr:succinate dehydrogenase cytochrome b subunit [Vicinamibacterales bacterium]